MVQDPEIKEVPFCYENAREPRLKGKRPTNCGMGTQESTYQRFLPFLWYASFLKNSCREKKQNVSAG